MDLLDSLHISAAGMRTQGYRLRIVAENLANAESVATNKDGEPYRRQMVTFKNVMDRTLGINTVQVDRIVLDPSEFGKHFSPNHPAADATGYVKTPNVNPLIEMTDMHEAERSYQANMKVLEASRTMLQRTIDMLR